MIRRQYRATMRTPNGDTFKVGWYFVRDSSASLGIDTIYCSSHHSPYPGDDGQAGEIPERNPAYAPGSIPGTVLNDHYCGLAEWFIGQWPAGTPALPLAANGWPVCCQVAPVAVTSVGLYLPATEFLVTGSPVTSSGTLGGFWRNQPAGTVLMGPIGGPDATPYFRLLVMADIPNLDTAKLTSGLMDPERIGTGTPDATKVLWGDSRWDTLPGGVSSVAMTVPPSILAVAGSPVTGSGTFAVTLLPQSANSFLAGPVSGGSAAPGMRALDAADFPAGVITSSALAAGAVGSAALAAGAVGSAALAAGAVGSAALAAGAVGTSNIAAGAVDTAALGAGAVTGAKIGAGAVGTSNIAAGAVDTAALGAGAVTGAKIAANTVASGNIINIDATTQLVGIIPAGNLPAGTPVAGNVGPFGQWIKTTLTKTDFNVAATSKTVTLVTLPAGGVLSAVKYLLNTVFSGGGGFPSGSIGFSSGGGTPASNVSKYASGIAISGPAATLATLSTTSQPDAQNESGSWNVTFTASNTANLNLLTQGSIDVWCLVSQAH